MSPLLNWKEIDLVVFDVDGTLYDQRRLRLAMLRRLLAATWQTRSLDTLRTLRTFRQVREALGDRPEADFMRLQYARTAAQHHKTEGEVRTLTHEWMERQPLPFLAGCRYPHVDALFAGLRSAGKQIAVFSDYPATDKLAALGLQAAPVVCTTDAEVARLKPDPAGLLAILRRTGVDAPRALMIGDRIDRDGVAASRAGMRVLIRASKPHPDYATFRAYDDPVFQPMLVGFAARVAG
ncbi:HAD family hydrolase [Polaromonas sp.]|uniref:HAD family hydrolase n=1 Tax=Polaromonas sp. TaxID=1869339 RepID=UPI0025FA7823|nr:HAD family hydrolase [Polaromonas sp.]